MKLYSQNDVLEGCIDTVELTKCIALKVKLSW
jgi:hypothetical protein